MKNQLSLVVVLASVATASAQVAPAMEWQKSTGGSLNDVARSVQQTSDGGYVIAGYTMSTDGDVSGQQGQGDAWVVKFDQSGTIEWQRAFGGANSDVANDIQQTVDGGYVLAGSTGSNNGDVSGNLGMTDAWVVKLNSVGAIQWQRTLGDLRVDMAYAVQQTADGGYVVAGYQEPLADPYPWQVLVAKLNSAGAIEWEEVMGGSSNDVAFDIQQLEDGGYVLAGQTASNDQDVSGNHGVVDGWVVRLNASGVIQWQKALGGSYVDQIRSIQLTTDGGYVVVGNTRSDDGDVSGNHGEVSITDDAWVVKLNDQGTIQWQRALGGSSSEVGNAVHQKGNGGYVVTGFTTSNDGDVTGEHVSGDVWVIGLDATGEIEWQRTLGGSGLDGSSDIQQTSDGGYVLTGFTSSSDGDVSGWHGGWDQWTVKLSTDVVGIESAHRRAFNVYPNPVQDQVWINFPSSDQNAEVTLTDALGKTLLRFGMSGSTWMLNLGQLPRGLYQLSISNASIVSHQTMVLE